MSPKINVSYIFVSNSIFHSILSVGVFGEHSVEYLAMDFSSKTLLDRLPELVLERIGQFCDVDTLENLFESLAEWKRATFPFKLEKRRTINLHTIKTELPQLNKYLRVKELDFHLQPFHPTVDTWRIFQNLSLKTEFIGHVEILKISNIFRK